jgi:predicted nucleic acid-binding protein
MPAFWDTSAIIHICVPGQSASAARRVLGRHAVVVWWTARVEVRSVLERLRKGSISPRAYDASRNRLEVLLSSWREILPSDSLRESACVQLQRFPIRAADALHLGAALIWCNQKPRGRLFVCNDRRLGNAARQAGFTVEAV